MSSFQQAIIGSTFVDGGIWLLIDAVIKVSVILLGAAMITWTLRGSSAAVRHLAWTVSMVAVLLVPILSMVLPPIHVLPNLVTNSLSVHDSATLLPLPELELLSTGDALNSAAQEATTAPTSQSASEATIVPAINSLRPIVLGLWYVGAIIMLLRTFLSFCVLRRLADGGHSIADSKIEEIVREVRRRLGLNAGIHVFLTDRRSIPMTWGIFSTHLLLPAEVAHWPPDRIRAVLLHELGHAKRRDMLSHLLAQMASAIFWFHPLVWIAVYRMHIERERACDDLVVATGLRPSAYAEHLVAVIARLQNHTLVPSSALAMAKPSMLEGRLVAILSDGISRKPIDEKLIDMWALNRSMHYCNDLAAPSADRNECQVSHRKLV